MKYKITPEQVKLMMDDILKRKNIKVDIMYRSHSLHTNDITATVYLYKDDQVFGYRFGYDFIFKYDKRFDTLTPEGHFPKIERFDFLKMIPESVILNYFTDKTEEYLRGYLDRGNVPAFKRLVSEELETTKSNYEKQVLVLKKLLKSKDYEGVCRYDFTHDEENDRVAGVYVIFSSDWYRQNDDSKYLNIQLIKIKTTKRSIENLVQRFLGIENLYVGSYLEDCNSSLNEQETPKDLAFHKALKRVIPDGSVYKSDYPLPYSDEGNVHIVMKYSVLPSSRIMKMTREDGTLYDAIQVHLQIDELLWKSDFDKEWERVEKTHSLPSSFWSIFEDDIADLVHKKMGLGYVEVYYKYPPIH